MNIIPESLQKKCKKHPMKKAKIGNISGSRPPSDESNLKPSDKIFELCYNFKQEKYNKLYGMDNNYGWLCIAALINKEDNESARVMISKIDNIETCKQYNWMYLLSMSKEAKSMEVDETDH